MAYWGKKSLASQKSPPEIIRLGDGINTFVNAFSIEKSEAVSSLNTSNQNYPALSVRQGFTSQNDSANTPLSGVNGATARNGDVFVVVEGTTWKYWNGSSYTNVATGLTDAQAKFVEFTTATKKYTIMANGTEKKYWDGSSVANLTDMPATRIICANDNRLFALTGSSLYTSDIGDITNWTTGDSDRIGLYGMVGIGTSVIAYNDMVIVFSDRTMHIVFGDTTDDFTVTEPIPIGCVSDKTLMVHGESGLLYWLDYEKVMVFSGGLPYEISQKVSSYLKNINYNYKHLIVMGQDKRYIYLSFPYGTSQTTNNLTLQYDTQRKTWYVFNIGFTDFFQTAENFFGISSSGIIYEFNDGDADDSSAITWQHITGIWEWKPLKNLKHITDMYAIVDLPSGSTLACSYSTTVDNDDFATLYTFSTDSDEQNVRFRIPTTKLQRINWFRLKFSGTGPCTIHYLEVHGRRGE